MPNLDEIKARRGKITQGKWEIPPDEDEFLDGSVNCGDKNIALCNYFESTFENMNVTLEDQKNNADFIANAPTDIDWLVAEVERLKAEKAQAEAERDVLLHELLKETHSHLCEDPERPCPFDEETEGEYCSNECANADPETCWRKYAQQQARSVGDARP